MTYKKRFAKYEVSCTWGMEKWFRYYENAHDYFVELVDGLTYDIVGLGEEVCVSLTDLTTGEVIDYKEIADPEM